MSKQIMNKIVTDTGKTALNGNASMLFCINRHKAKNIYLSLCELLN